MYTLYYSPGSASMVVHLALLEISTPHRLELVDFDADQQHRFIAHLACHHIHGYGQISMGSHHCLLSNTQQFTAKRASSNLRDGQDTGVTSCGIQLENATIPDPKNPEARSL